MTLYVDTSRDGVHGIGRYSREVVTRLSHSWTDLGHRFRKPLPVDALNPRRMSLAARDVIYAPGFNAGLSRATQLLTLHDLIHLQVRQEGSALKRLYYEKIVRPAVRKAGVVFTVSETSRQHILEWVRDPLVEVVDTGNGVSLPFSVDGRRWTSDREYVVYVGNLREHKNVDVVLRALRKVTDIDLVMVTSDRDDAARRLGDLNLLDRVSLLSGIDDSQLASVYRGSLGLVMPSKIEGYGLPAAEAIACGVPVAFWGGCESVAEIVATSGISVGSASDADAWAEAIAALAAVPSFEPRRRSWDEVAAVVNARLEMTT